MRLLLVLSGVSLVASAFGQTTVSPSTTTVNAAIGNGTFTLTQTTAAAWTAASSAAWLTVSPPTGSGSQTFTYNFTANPNPEARMATITVADRAFALLQRGTTGLYTPWSTIAPGQIVSLDGYPGSFLNAPMSVAVDGNGDVYIADTGNNRVQRLDAVTGVITTEAGNGINGATEYAFRSITGVAADSSGSPLFIADGSTDLITRVDRVAGVTSVLASETLARFASVAVDSAGNAYFTTFTPSSSGNTSAIWRLDAVTFGLSTVATLGGGPDEATLDAIGDFYAADGESGQILRIDALTGNVTTVIAGHQPSGYQPSGLAVDGRGNLYIASAASDSVQRVDALTSAVTAVGSGLSGPAGVATDALGNLYIANTGASEVLFVDMVTPQGAVLSNVPQTIVFSLPGTTNYNSPPFSVSAIASSGLPVSFVSNTPSVCTVNGATVSLVYRFSKI
jgi:streptogramin lyase